MSAKILVLGANGPVGAPLVDELLRRGEKVKAASRRAVAQLPSGAEPVRVDLDDPGTIGPALADVDRIYAISPGGYVDQLALLKPVVEAAAARKAKVVLQSAMGVEANDAIPLRQVELMMERSGIPFVILRPTWFSDNFANYWSSHVARGEIRLPAGDGKTSFIDARDIAASAAAALTSNRHDGQAFALTGASAHGYDEAANLLSQALGRRITYRNIDDATFIAEFRAAGFSELYATLIAGIFHPVREGWTSIVTDAVETLSGRAPRSFANSIVDVATRLKVAA